MVSNGGSKLAVRTSRSSSVSVLVTEKSDSRKRTDQVKPGVKVINGGAKYLEADDKTENQAPMLTRSASGPGSAGKRRACKPDSNSVQIVRVRSLSQLQKKKNCVAVGYSNGNCKSPVQSQKRESAFDDGDERSGIVMENSRSNLKSSKAEDSLEANGSDRAVEVADQRISTGLKNYGEEYGGYDGEIDEVLAQSEREKARSDELKEDEREEDVDDGESVDRSVDGSITSYASEENEEEEVEERIDEEIEVEKNVTYDEEFRISCDETIRVEKPIASDEEELVVENNSSGCEDKEMNVNYSIPNRETDSKPKTIETARSSGVQFSPVQKQTPKFSRSTHSTPVRGSDAKQRGAENHSKLQSVVDLLMWKHVPRSSLVFGVGTFLIISSSYTKDLNISFISVTSYLGLIYLGISFLFKSFKCRNITGGNDMSYCYETVVIGEEEAIWLSRLVLPSLNEFLLKLKPLFCGDPAVTMKLAAVLFALARCGSSITMWNMVKLGFFAAFTLPKFCSSYSTQFTLYGKFWFLRFQDAWRSCTHKKVVGFAMFTVVWNLSSVVARIWAAFMLFVAVRYYQQSITKAEIWDDVEVEADNHVLLARPQAIRKLRQGRPSLSPKPIPSRPVDLKGAKKGS